MKKTLLCLILLINNTRSNDVTVLKTLQIKYYQELTTKQIIKELNIPKKYSKIEFSSIPTLTYIGTKEYFLFASDFKNEIKTYSFAINVIDDVPPIIYGPEIIYLNNDTLLDSSIILNHYSAYDEIDKNVQIFIEEINEYKTYFNVKIYAKDKSNNITQNKIKIIKNPNNYSLYIRSNLELTIIKNKIYHKNELINELIKTMQIEKVKFQEIRINNNLDYIKYDSTGIQNIDVDLKYNNNIKTINIKLNVIDNQQNNKEKIKMILINIYRYFINLLSRGKYEKN